MTYQISIIHDKKTYLQNTVRLYKPLEMNDKKTTHPEKPTKVTIRRYLF